jgi:hypothetical protein
VLWTGMWGRMLKFFPAHETDVIHEQKRKK